MATSSDSSSDSSPDSRHQKKKRSRKRSKSKSHRRSLEDLPSDTSSSNRRSKKSRKRVKKKSHRSSRDREDDSSYERSRRRSKSRKKRRKKERDEESQDEISNDINLDAVVQNEAARDTSISAKKPSIAPTESKPDSPSASTPPQSTPKGPMTQQQYQALQSQIREVVDPHTGRKRWMRGTGEIVERIVSREEHLSLNQCATRGDGGSFSRDVVRAAMGRK